MSKVAEVKVLLDKPRTMRFGFNEAIAFEKHTKRNWLRGEGVISQTMEEMRYFFYLCLRKEDPKLTPEYVGQFIYAEQFFECSLVMQRLIAALRNGEAQDNRTLAPFVPTPDEVVQVALNMAESYYDDIDRSGFNGKTVLDLGAGDGRVMISARKRGAACCIGYEIHDERATNLERCFETSGISDTMLVRRKDCMDAGEDVAHADVIFIYLLTPSNVMLTPMLERYGKPGAQIITHQFPMPGWEAKYGTIVEVGEQKHGVFQYVFGEHRRDKKYTTGVQQSPVTVA